MSVAPNVSSECYGDWTSLYNRAEAEILLDHIEFLTNFVPQQAKGEPIRPSHHAKGYPGHHCLQRANGVPHLTAVEAQDQPCWRRRSQSHPGPRHDFWLCPGHGSADCLCMYKEKTMRQLHVSLITVQLVTHKTPLSAVD
jgi:hypothetical protein